MNGPLSEERLAEIKANAARIDPELISHAVWMVLGQDVPELLGEIERLKGDTSRVLHIVAAWCTQANDIGGVDAGDLAWHLEQAGFELPDESEPT